MKWPRPRLTVRVRLTLLYTGLFAACGAVVVAITYGLLAANLPVPNADVPLDKASVQDPKGVQRTQVAPEDFDIACEKALVDPADGLEPEGQV